MKVKKKDITKHEEIKNASNFFVIVAVTLVIMSFLIVPKFNALVIADFNISKYAFCENPSFETKDDTKKINCDNWIDVSASLEKLDGNYLILKKGNVLIFSPDSSTSGKLRMIGNSLEIGVCMNLKPDYEGKMNYNIVTVVCSTDSTLIDYTFNFVKVNEEISQSLGYTLGSMMKTMLIETQGVIEIDTIADKNILIAKGSERKKVALDKNIPALTQDYGSKYLDTRNTTSNLEICEGCLVNNVVCIKQGNIFNVQYCDIDNILKDKKQNGSLCSQDYECATDLCKEKCVSIGIIAKIKNWFKNIFR